MKVEKIRSIKVYDEDDNEIPFRVRPRANRGYQINTKLKLKRL